MTFAVRSWIKLVTPRYSFLSTCSVLSAGKDGVLKGTESQSLLEATALLILKHLACVVLNGLSRSYRPVFPSYSILNGLSRPAS